MSKKLSQRRVIDIVLSRLGLLGTDDEDMIREAIKMYNTVRVNELLDGSTIHEDGIGVIRLKERNSRAVFGKESPKELKKTVILKSDIDWNLKNEYLSRTSSNKDIKSLNS